MIAQPDTDDVPVIPESAVRKGEVDDDGRLNNLDLAPSTGLLATFASDATAVSEPSPITRWMKGPKRMVRQ